MDVMRMCTCVVNFSSFRMTASVVHSRNLCRVARHGSGSVRWFSVSPQIRTTLHVDDVRRCQSQILLRIQPLHRQLRFHTPNGYSGRRHSHSKQSAIADASPAAAVESLHRDNRDRKDDLDGDGYFDQLNENPLTSSEALQNKIDETQSFSNGTTSPAKRIPSKDELGRLVIAHHHVFLFVWTRSNVLPRNCFT